MTPVEYVLVRKLINEATPPPTEHGRVGGKFIDEHAEDFRTSLLQGEIEEDGRIVVWGVYIAGTNVPICHTGNGPTSERNARFIEFAFNNMSALTEAAAFDFVAYLKRQREFSERTFGPGARAQGVCDHIRKELREIEAQPGDLTEWIDVTMLALDGAWRAGFTPEQIAEALAAKLAKNEGRTWPDWRTVPEGKAIEHVRGDEA